MRLLGQQQGDDNHIALDHETFEVVRQIQELRATLASNSPSTVSSSGVSAGPDAPAGLGTTASATAGHGAAAAAAATAVGESPTQTTTSDEKLINLFLRMAGREPGWQPRTGGEKSGSTGGGSSSNEDSAGAAAQAAGAAAAAAQSTGLQQQGQGGSVDTVLRGLATQMSIDDRMDAPRADAPGTDIDEMPPPPRQEGEQRFGEGGIEGAGGAELARLQKDKVNKEWEIQERQIFACSGVFVVIVSCLASTAMLRCSLWTGVVWEVFLFMA